MYFTLAVPNAHVTNTRATARQRTQWTPYNAIWVALLGDVNFREFISAIHERVLVFRTDHATRKCLIVCLYLVVLCTIKYVPYHGKTTEVQICTDLYYYTQICKMMMMLPRGQYYS